MTRERWEATTITVFIATRMAYYLVHPHCAEDFFLTARAARTWLETGAPTFNAGLPSWPASSPLWLGWCALGLGIGAPIEWWARLGSLVAECFLLVAIWRMAGQRVAIAFAILLAFFQHAITISLSGIEMYAMCAAFAWALLGNRLALTLLVLSRPEGVLLGAVIMGSEAMWPRIGSTRDYIAKCWHENEHRAPWHTAGRWLGLIAPFAVGLAGWTLLAVLCRTWLPAGVSAKVGSYGLHWFHGGVWLGLFWPFGPTSEQRTLGVIGLAALVALLWMWRQRTAPTLTAATQWFTLAGFAMLAVYFIIGAPYFMWWITLPMLACMLVVALACSHWRHGWIIAGIVASLSWTNDYVTKRWDIQYDGFSRLARVMPRSGSALMDPVGIIGWLRPELRIIDMVGLVSPETRLERANGDGWLGRLIRRVHPDAIMLNGREMDTNVPDAGAGKLFLPGDDFPEYTQRATTSLGHVILLRKPPLTSH